MKTQINLIAFFIFCLHLGTNAQDCDYMRKYKTGSRIQYTNYDKKGKVIKDANDTYTEIFDKTATATGWKMEMGTNLKDKDGNFFKKVSFFTFCENGIYNMDLKQDMLLPLASIDPKTNISVDITGEPMRLPILEVGKEQPEWNVEITTMMGDITLMKAKIRNYDMKVVSLESLTTPLGVLECYKITYLTEMKMLGNKKMSTEL